MYKNNSRNSSKFKSCSPLPKAFGTATCSYTNVRCYWRKTNCTLSILKI